MAAVPALKRQKGLRALREAAGRSRYDLVAALAVKGLKYTEAALYNLETGRSEHGTSVTRARAMADVLSEWLGRHVGIDDLFPREGSLARLPQPTSAKGSRGSGSSRRSSRSSRKAADQRKASGPHNPRKVSRLTSALRAA